MIGEMSSPWREAVKRHVPGIVHLARMARLLRNQVRYPLVSTALDVPGRIHAGPFAGVRYPRSGIGNGYLEVLGTYEQCLIPLVETVIRHPPRLIIDVGAAYGYYALGFAKRCPHTHVIAYEMDATRVALIDKYKRQNQVRISTRAECTIADLVHDLRETQHALIFMDVEGAEDFLLLPEQIPALAQTEIIVETHDAFVPGVTKRICERFASTHVQTVINEIPIQPMPLPKRIAWIVQPFWSILTADKRTAKNMWLHLVPKIQSQPA